MAKASLDNTSSGIKNLSNSNPAKAAGPQLSAGVSMGKNGMEGGISKAAAHLGKNASGTYHKPRGGM